MDLRKGISTIQASLRLLDEEATHEEVIRVVQEDGLALGSLPLIWRDDRDVVLAAVARDGWALQYATKRLRDDREVCRVAVSTTGNALGCANEASRRDFEVVLTAVQTTPFALGYASKELQANRDVVLAAVSRDGNALAYASKALRDDKEIVAAAIEANPEAIEFAGDRYRADGGAALVKHRRESRRMWKPADAEAWSVLRAQGQLDEREPLLRDLLEQRRESLGEDHLDTLDSVSILAVMLLKRGSRVEAERLALQARRGVDLWLSGGSDSPEDDTLSQKRAQTIQQRVAECVHPPEASAAATTIQSAERAKLARQQTSRIRLAKGDAQVGINRR